MLLSEKNYKKNFMKVRKSNIKTKETLLPLKNLKVQHYFIFIAKTKTRLSQLNTDKHIGEVGVMGFVNRNSLIFFFNLLQLLNIRVESLKIALSRKGITPKSLKPNLT